MKKKIFFFICFSLGLMTGTTAQVTVTVTNPTNTTPNLAAGYTSLANAVTAVNSITAMSGPVILTCAAGAETAPAGGYSINNPGGTSATNTITFTTAGTVTITASPSLTAGSLTDAIFKLIGADYVTISGFTMKENAANSNNISATNNMTEWGVALLYASTANGSQNNTIQNNTIILDRNYLNSFGIYSNTRHSAANVAGEISNNTTAPNNNNKFYGNTISNVNCGIALIGSAVAANKDQGNDIGGNSSATGNMITNWGKDTTSGVFVSGPSLGISCIFLNDQTNENVSYNTLISATINYFSAAYASGIDKEYFGSQPVGTITTSINHNTITITDSSAAGGFFNSHYVTAIMTQGITGLSTATININDNIILNCAEVRAASSPGFGAIINYCAAGVVNMNNNIIKGCTAAAPNASVVGLINYAAVITTLNINNNQLGVAGSGFVSFTNVDNFVHGIFISGAASTCTVNVNNNSIDGISARNGSVYGIRTVGSFSSTPTPVNVNINNNRFGSVTGTFASFSDAPVSSNGLYGIYNTIGDASTTLHIDDNDFTGITYAVSSSYGGASFIVQTAALLSSNITGNTFTNLNINTGGSVNFIAGPGAMTSTGTWSCTNNSIVGTFNKPAAGGYLMCINTSGAPATGSSINISGNNFSNISLAGSTGFYGLSDQAGSFSTGPTKTITGNIFSNITYGSGTVYGISVDYGTALTCSTNTITGFSGTGPFNGITIGTAIGGNVNCSSNTISNITTTSLFYGVTGGASSIPTFNINGNTFSSINCPMTTVIYITSGPSVNIYDNTFSGITSSSAAANLRGIHILNCAAANVYRNKLYGFSATANTSGGTPFIYGMFLNSVVSTTINVYNNFVADFTAPSISGTDVIRGIHIGASAANTTYNVYYNSVYLDASSTGTDFGTCALYHLINPTATTNTLNLINNIIVNTSVPAGTGKTAAFRRSSSVSLSNYASTSDYNLFYAGTPAASRLIYYDGTNQDQTLSAFQTRVSPRDAHDISVMPAFTSVTDLHLTAANCLVDGRGTNIAGYTTDIDNATRNATTPDMGADEFIATAGVTLAGINGAATCDYRNVSVTGTTFSTNSCGLIGYVLPSGAAPVSGYINTCVTLDAAVLTFNGEPYVQRHYDIEPANTPATATATITLYFTDQEFINYNTLYPVWPPLPTNGAGNTVANRNNVRITQFHGTPTGGLPTSTPGNYTGTRELITPGAANVVWNGTYWEVTLPVTGFSGFYLHTTLTNAPLPIVVNYLTGRKQGSNHLLNWKVTCASTPRATMTLERSSNGRNYTGINTITADAARCQQPFDYTDANPLKGMNYYRLKIVDAAGKITYSTTVALLNAVKGFDIISIAPNPFVNNDFKLNVTSATAGKMEISIFDMQGRLMNRQTLSVIAGYNSIPVHITNLASGTYTLQGNVAGEKSHFTRFIKQ